MLEVTSSGAHTHTIQQHDNTARNRVVVIDLRQHGAQQSCDDRRMIFSCVLPINSLQYCDRGVLDLLWPMDCTLFVVHAKFLFPSCFFYLFYSLLINVPHEGRWLWSLAQMSLRYFASISTGYGPSRRHYLGCILPSRRHYLGCVLFLLTPIFLLPLTHLH